jgi:hypothetical protein
MRKKPSAKEELARRVERGVDRFTSSGGERKKERWLLGRDSNPQHFG